MLISATIVNAQTDYNTLLRDFQNVSGSWQGFLTYLDYSSGKPYTMPANVYLKQQDTSNKFLLFNTYPNETSANSVDTVVLSANGNYINHERVVSRRKLPNGEVELVTEESGKDGNDNKAATFKHTYTFGKTSFKKRKDVQFNGQTTWIMRHEYSYTKKSGH